MANPHKRDGKPAEEVRKSLVDLLRQGSSIADALKIIGRSRSWYEQQRRADRDWAGFVDSVRAHVSDPQRRAQDAGSFSDFCGKYLGRQLFPHQMNMVALLEGQEPPHLHPSMRYEKGVAGGTRLLVNVPPNHAKSMTITIEYVTYRIIRDPDLSVMIVSKTQEMAKKMIYAIKQRLTHPRYADLQLAFAPADGWKASADQWNATRVYLNADARGGAEKDPTLEALGMGGQIYGSRAGLIVLDDCVTLTNANEWEKQMEWVRQEVGTRLGPGGQLLVVGTRVAATDLYSELRNPEHYTDGVIPWTYLSMPAVLDYGDGEDEWQTLWPKSDEPFVEGDTADEDGLFDRWTGPRLARVRNEVGPRKWSLVYQNLDIEEDSTFDAVAVRGSVNEFRKAGPLNPALKGHPIELDGFYVICSMDPAVAGNTAALAYAVHRGTGERYVLDVRVLSGPTPAQIRELITEMTERYKPFEWVVEANAFQGFLVYDEGINQYLANQGIILKPHFTGNNKQDPDFGVASMSGLFGTVSVEQSGRRSHQKDNLIHLPSTTSHGVKLLVEELISWSPKVKTRYRRQDTVMSLWFAELRAREKIGSSSMRPSFLANEFLSERDKNRQMTINLDELFAANQAQWV
jgi:hypothetical protein